MHGGVTVNAFVCNALLGFELFRAMGLVSPIRLRLELPPEKVMGIPVLSITGIGARSKSKTG